METIGVEPITFSLQARCSTNLSYVPKGANLACFTGAGEALHVVRTSCALDVFRSPKKNTVETIGSWYWSQRPDSNR